MSHTIHPIQKLRKGDRIVACRGRSSFKLFAGHDPKPAFYDAWAGTRMVGTYDTEREAAWALQDYHQNLSRR